MLRTAVIASLGLRRLLVASTTAAAPGYRPSLLLRCISGPSASPQLDVRRFLPNLDLTRGYARGRQSSFGDGEPDFDEEYDEEMDDGYEFSDKDDMDDMDLGDDLEVEEFDDDSE